MSACIDILNSKLKRETKDISAIALEESGMIDAKWTYLKKYTSCSICGRDMIKGEMALESYAIDEDGNKILIHTCNRCGDTRAYRALNYKQVICDKYTDDAEKQQLFDME